MLKMLNRHKKLPADIFERVIGKKIKEGLNDSDKPKYIVERILTPKKKFIEYHRDMLIIHFVGVGSKEGRDRYHLLCVNSSPEQDFDNLEELAEHANNEWLSPGFVQEFPSKENDFDIISF